MLNVSYSSSLLGDVRGPVTVDKLRNKFKLHVSQDATIKLINAAMEESSLLVARTIRGTLRPTVGPMHWKKVHQYGKTQGY